MPLLTVMSPTTKLDVASLAVKVRARVASLDVAPSLTSAAVIARVGGVVSEGEPRSGGRYVPVWGARKAAIIAVAP